MININAVDVYWCVNACTSSNTTCTGFHWYTKDYTAPTGACVLWYVNNIAANAESTSKCYVNIAKKAAADTAAATATTEETAILARIDVAVKAAEAKKTLVIASDKKAAIAAEKVKAKEALESLIKNHEAEIKELNLGHSIALKAEEEKYGNFTEARMALMNRTEAAKLEAD